MRIDQALAVDNAKGGGGVPRAEGR